MMPSHNIHVKGKKHKHLKKPLTKDLKHLLLLQLLSDNYSWLFILSLIIQSIIHSEDLVELVKQMRKSKRI